jgi:hypothetical protein
MAASARKWWTNHVLDARKERACSEQTKIFPTGLPPGNWAAFAAEMKRVVRPGGLVAVFEHNPLNPLTRVSVSRCPFDEDVTLLRAGTTARLMTEAGLQPVERRFFYFLPVRDVATSRIERALRGVPLGAQYFVAGLA